MLGVFTMPANETGRFEFKQETIVDKIFRKKKSEQEQLCLCIFANKQIIT